MTKIVLKNLISEQKKILVSQIKLDKENPRYRDQLDENKSSWDEGKIKEVIENDDVSDIEESIKKHGVLDPIWVIQTSKNKYDVIEGSRRLFVLNKLLDDKIKPPSGIYYKTIRANIIPKSTPSSLIDIQRVLLQTGKKPWGPYNVASVINNLAKQGFDSKYIANAMGKKTATIDKELMTYDIYTKYGNFLEERGFYQQPRKYTYFQRAGESVKKRFFTTDSGLGKFFNLITPDKDKKARISNVSLEGGLMQFNTIAQDDDILDEFLANKEMTVVQALTLYNGKHLIGAFPWMKLMVNISEKIQDLDSKEYKIFKKNKSLNKEIRNVYKFCKRIIEE